MSRLHDAFRRIEEPRVVASVIVLAAIGFTLPFAIKQNSWAEWGTTYWAIQQQADSIADTGLPTRFVSTPESGAFYPWFVFYAGGTSSILGYLAQVIGSWGAFLASISMAFAAAIYGGFLALRAFKCPPQISLLLALAAAFSPHMVTLLYGGGAWAELIGASFARLLVGAGLALLQAQETREQVSRLLLVASSTFILAISHNLSFAIGLPFAGALWLAFFLTGGPLSQGRNAYLLVGGVISGLGLSGAWLFPNVAYGSETLIYSWDYFGSLASFDQLRVVFSPLLYYPEEQTRLNLIILGEFVPIRTFHHTLSLVLLPVAWIVAQLLIEPLRALGQKGARDIAITMVPRWGRLSFLLGLMMVFVVLMTNEAAWELLPNAVRIIQFPFRLNPYLTLLIVLCAGVATSIVTTQRRGSRGLLIVVCAGITLFYLGLAGYQSLTAQRVGPPGLGSASRAEIDAAGAPPTWASSAASVQFRTVPEASLQRPESRVRVSGLPQRAPRTVSQRLATNVNCSPFVSFSSAVRVIGTDDYGKCVLEVEEPGGSLEVFGAWPFASKLGLVGSAVGLALLALLLGWARRSRTGLS